MYEDKDFTGIYHMDLPNLSFGSFFAKRQTDINEIAASSLTPRKDVLNDSEKNETNGSDFSRPGASSTFLTVPGKKQWPANENTYLIGDIENWSKYRPNNQSLNFTELAEEKTVYWSGSLIPVCNATTDKSNVGASAKKVKPSRIPLADIRLPEPSTNIVPSRQPLSLKAKSIVSQIEDALAIDEFKFSDGPFPLCANLAELVWGCVPLNETVTQYFSIRNKSDKLLRLKVDIIGAGFRLSADTKQFIDLTGKCLYHIGITFNPLEMGESKGTVRILPARSWPNGEERAIYLWAYGGIATLRLENIFMNVTMPILMLKPDTEPQPKTTVATLKGTFVIRNTGTAYAVVILSNIKIECEFINEYQVFIMKKKNLIPTNSVEDIEVVCQCNQKVLAQFMSTGNILTIGSIKLLYGSEPNRQRIAAILKDDDDRGEFEFLVHGFPGDGRKYFENVRYHEDTVANYMAHFSETEILLQIGAK